MTDQTETTSDDFPKPRQNPGGEPCGECHLKPGGETCDICGAVSKTTLDQAMARLFEAHGPSPEMKRLAVVKDAHTELFDAASVILGWMRGLRAEDRPLAKFNRLQDAINGVREAHQMDPADVKR